MARLMRLNSVRSFAVYYGFGREEELACFDMAVVEPKGHTGSGLAEVKSRGTLLIAYLSIMEVPFWDENNKLLTPADYLWEKGKIITNKLNYNPWLNMASPKWKKILLHQVSFLLEQRGYDGLFLDTAAYVEDHRLAPDLRQELMHSICTMIYQIRSLYPEHILIQNGGFNQLYTYTLPFIDGLCWENPLLKKAPEIWMSNLIARLKAINKKEQKIILILAEEENSESNWENAEKAAIAARSLAEDNDFLFYLAPCNYLGRVNYSAEKVF